MRIIPTRDKLERVKLLQNILDSARESIDITTYNNFQLNILKLLISEDINNSNFSFSNTDSNVDFTQNSHSPAKPEKQDNINVLFSKENMSGSESSIIPEEHRQTEVDRYNVYNDYPDNYVVKYHITGIEDKIDDEWVYTGLQLTKVIYDYETSENVNTSLNNNYSNFRVVDELVVMTSLSGNLELDHQVIVNSYSEILNDAFEITENPTLNRYKIHSEEDLNRIIILNEKVKDYIS